MNLNRSTPRYLGRLLATQACALLAVSSLWAQEVPKPTTEATAPATTPAPRTAPVVTTAPATTSKEEVVELSPFTVNTTKDAGYYAENTLAGSRLNTNLGDLAASITVVTKAQMEDTASLDINDVFRYEASTEGSSTYTPVIIDRSTAKDVLGGYTFGNDGTTTTNAQANRIRGLTAPDAAINNFPSANRIPFDAYNIQSVEITRGPNSLLFGLGAPSGIVNQTTTKAALNRDTSEVTVRTDQYGSFRTALTVNRSLIPDKLAFAGAFVYYDEQFQRKPSGDLTRREYGTITYKPFKGTTIRAFGENYQNSANRPNSLTPRDLITPWLQSGRPAYDPTTRMITVLDTGAVYGPYVNSTFSPGYVKGNNVGNGALNTYFLTAAPVNTNVNPTWMNGIYFDDVTRPLRLINGTNNSVAYFQRNPALFAAYQTNPANTTLAPWAANNVNSLGWTPGTDARWYIYDREWSSSSLNYPSKVVNGTTYTYLNGVAYGSYMNPGITNKNLYDWTKYNDVQSNFSTMRAGNYSLEIEQQLLPNLFFSAGWMRQDIDSTENNTMGQLTGNTLQVDTNQKLPDGTVNPYFGNVFIEEGQGGGMDTYVHPQTDDNFRAMLSYDLDLTKENGILKWLGRHRLLGMWSRLESKQAVERWRNSIVDGDPDAKLRYVPNLTLSGQSLALNPLSLERKYYMSNPGDPQGVVTHSSGFWGNKGWDGPLSSQVEVFKYNYNVGFTPLNTSASQTGANLLPAPASPGTWANDTIVEQSLFSSAGSFRTKRQVNSWTMAAQSYLWDERIVTTLGFRHDAYRARITTVGAVTDVNGNVLSPALTNDQLYLNNFTGNLNHDVVMNRWGRWDSLSGNTRTLGGAFHVFKGMSFVQNIGGSGSLISELLEGLTLFYNKSANFNPPLTYNTDYFAKPLAKPTGKGKDFGIGFSLFQNKLVGRINWYETTSLNERSAAGATPLGRLAYSDSSTGTAWASAIRRIQNAEAAGKTFASIIAAPGWNSDAVNNVSGVADQQAISALIQLPYQYYSRVATAGTQDTKAKGTEVQITYNPTNNWTIKLTGDKQETVYSNVLPQYDAWLAVRMPIWTSLVSPFPVGAPENDFTDGSGQHYVLTKFWDNSYGYSAETRPTTTPRDYFNAVVVPPVSLVKGLAGTTTPDQRKYHAKILTNYMFTSGKLKGFSFGGAEVWESKAAIGFRGYVATPDVAPGVVNLADPTQPVYDSGNFYTDLWVAYGRKIFNNKIAWKVQLNINNALEGGRLMPIAINLDGTPYAWRIIDSRQFVLSSTFSF